jgi:O-antigen ligase
VKEKSKINRSTLLTINDDNWYFLIPLLVIVAIVPLIVYLKVVPLQGEALKAWNGQTENADFFSYYKAIWLEIAAVSALILLLAKAYLDYASFNDMSNSRIRSRSKAEFYSSQFSSKYWTYLYIPIAAYVILAVLSAVNSKYPGIAFGGFPDRYEGLWVLLAYMVVLVTTFNLVRSERQLKVMLWGIFTSAVVIGVIGFFQYLGYDIFKTSWGESLILPSQYLKYADQLKFQFGAHTIYATLYHTDYVGSFTALIFPLALALFVLEKKIIRKIIYGLLTALTVFTWLGCNSRAGMFGGVLAVLVLLVALRKKILEHWKILFIGIIVLVALIFGLDRLSHGYLGKRIDSLKNDALSIVSGKVDKNETIPLKNVQINGNKALVATSDGTLNMMLQNNSIFFTNAKNQPIHIQSDASKGEVKFLDPKYSMFQIKMGLLNKKHAVILQDNQIKLYFGVDNGKFTFLNFQGDEIPLKRPPAWGFAGRERIGSSRGYIWSRSIPLLKNTVWLGNGPDTFAAFFPQYDIFGKMYAYGGDMWQVVDKPHDFYLQTALNTGILSLAAFLALFVMYLVDCIRTYFWEDFSSLAAKAGVGFWAGVTGYLGAGFFNDSIVSVAPVFWAILGLGIAANRMVRAQRKERESVT